MKTAATDDNKSDHGDRTGTSVNGVEVSVLDLILMRVRLRAKRRAAWLQNLWGSTAADSYVQQIEAGLDDRDTPWAELKWYSESSSVAAENRAIEHIETLLAGDAGAHLRHLESLFGLSEQESDILQICLAETTDSDLGPVFAYLRRHTERRSVTPSLAARLFGYGRQAIWHATSPLAAWGLVHEVSSGFDEPTVLRCDPHIIRWLQGNLDIDPQLVSVVREVECRAPLDSWPVERVVQHLRRSFERESGVRIVLEGPTGCGRKTLAAAVGGQFGVATLAIDTSQIAEERWPDAYMRAQRLAILGGTAIVWHGNGLQRRWPAQIGSAQLQFIACEEAEVVTPHTDLIDHRIVVPNATLDERTMLWSRHVPESGAWPAPDRQALINRHRLSVGDIVSLGRRCPASAREASAVCREMTRTSLGEYGQLLDCPFSWDDLVVPKRLRSSLEDFAYEARERITFWESAKARRLFPRGTALVGLLAGPPGTGKTMAAQVVAASLDLDLFRIDLATVVSKYIGETVKNLSRIFSRAARMNAVLLFDEADALFSKRTDVRDSHDRYANTDTNYLLQLMEEYKGIAFLATNKKSNIDPAFTRRVRYVLSFLRPDAKLRQKIWHQVIAELSGDDTANRLADVVGRLAQGIEASGAQIKNSVLASLFIARRAESSLGERHLVQGLERELSKEGRSLGREEQELIRYA